ncbi:hypothetical protein DID77_03990 [Candidatus Marinamargulisbacteria bacterium SCGC AG-439-L15]|nr:hypothetical protein DID77_03990 [Candidatus Marinamargulisbacteria bacterium SCGC AG-439-L15]
MSEDNQFNKTIPVNLKKQLESDFKGIVHAVYLYGQEYKDLLMIIEDDFGGDLDPFLPLKKNLGKECESIKLFTVSEFKNSLDVFPIEFLDMKENRELLVGTDIFLDLHVEDHNLRHESEFYLRSHLLKCRESFLKGWSSPKQLVQDSLPAFLKVLKYSLNLTDGTPLMGQLESVTGLQLPQIKAFIESDLKTVSDASFLAYLNELSYLNRYMDTCHA